MVRRVDGDSGLLGELLSKEVDELLVKFVTSKTVVGNARERVEETISDGDDAGSGCGSSDVEDDDVSVDRERFPFRSNIGRLVGDEGGG